ncbi:MAG: hypothetical protein ETSY2_44770 [Candidatus Entotheonella gemina]|uniref:Uncharacterized protein n=1 Tax=Candidatus Entotheonella gemina TaxID=1429439 RepID=W4LH09_9BACT|nr:MAG: hypothetical protein ETSY2_44770 [Candidatus Entotheonella gemina]
MRGKSDCNDNQPLKDCKNRALNNAIVSAEEDAFQELVKIIREESNSDLPSEDIMKYIELDPQDKILIKKGFTGEETEEEGYYYRIDYVFKGKTLEGLKDIVFYYKSTGRPQKIKPSNKDNKYHFTVITTPKDTSIKIMNISPVYKLNIKLNPSKYTILVEKYGYYSTIKEYEIINKDLSPHISLEKDGIFTKRHNCETKLSAKNKVVDAILFNATTNERYYEHMLGGYLKRSMRRFKFDTLFEWREKYTLNESIIVYNKPGLKAFASCIEEFIPGRQDIVLYDDNKYYGFKRRDLGIFVGKNFVKYINKKQ